LGLALAELSEVRALIGQMGPRHGNMRETKEGRICIIPSILIESQTIVSIYLSGWRGWKQPTLAPVFISETLGIVKSNSRDK